MPNLTPSRRRVQYYLDFAASSPAMQAAQLRTIIRQAPLFYGMLCLNFCILLYSYGAFAPWWLTVAPACMVTPLCLIRALYYTRLQGRTFSPEETRRRLHTMTRFVWVIMTFSAVWAILLAQYGGEAQRMHILGFAIIQALFSIFGLLHIPTTGLSVAAPFSVLALYFAFQDEASVRYLAAMFLAILLATVFMSFIYYEIFLSHVKQNEQLAKLGSDNLRLANTDLLTDLPNRRSFFERIEGELLAPHTDQETLYLGLIDLDGFKPVNDTYGHSVGDAVLKEVGSRLNGLGAGVFCARLGGDEFGFLVQGSRAEAQDLAEEARKRLCQTYVLSNATIKIAATIGLARAVDAKGVASRLVEIADYALYQGKTGGRNTVVVFDGSHEQALDRHARIERALRDGDLDAEFSLRFQPIVSADSGRTVAFEALARWHSPQLGEVSPAEFIPVAEACEMITDLTAILFAKALAETASWPDDIVLSFNLSAQDLVSPQTAPLLSAMIAASRIAAGRICFEITETAVIRDFQKAQATLNDLKTLGISLALDDFGTGYSSLSHVHRLPIDKLKIDRSFTIDLEASGACRDIVKSIIGLCGSLRLECVAEGVETRQQGDILRGFGCHHMQGFGISRPLTPAGVSDYLTAERGPGPLRRESRA